MYQAPTPIHVKVLHRFEKKSPPYAIYSMNADSVILFPVNLLLQNSPPKKQTKNKHKQTNKQQQKQVVEGS